MATRLSPTRQRYRWVIEPTSDPFFASGITDVVEAWTEACSKWFGPRQSVVDQLVAEMTETGKQS
jgi:hypothetical protein